MQIERTEPGWSRALHHLARGERDGAVGALGESAEGEDGRAAALLRSTLGLNDGGGAREPATIEEDGPSEPSSSAGRVIRTLTAARHAGRAVREGRITDLVQLARLCRSSAPSEYPWLEFRAASLLQAAFRFTADPGLGDEAIRLCGQVADRVDLPHLAVPARALLGNLHLLHGRLHATVECCDAALDLARATDLEGHRVAAMAHQFRAYALFEWNRLDEAEVELERAWALTDARATGVRSGTARVMALLRSARGDAEGAERWLERLEEVVREPMTMRNREWLSAARLRVRASETDLRTVERWRRSYDYREDTLSTLPDEQVPARLQEFDHLLALLESTRQWPVILDVAPIVRRAAERCRAWFLVRALTAEAVALEGSGRSSEADARTDEALEAGEVGSFVRVYVDGSPLRRRILARALTRRPVATHAERIRNAAPEFFDAAVESHDLTPAQTRVLQLVAAGCSNREAAEELGVGVTTVKTHLRAAYERLGVRSRTRAVAEARKLGILSD